MDFRLEYRRYALPFRQAVRTSRGSWVTREGIYVRLEHSDGRVGYGEASPVPGFGSDSIDGTEAACRSLGENPSEGVLGAVPRSLASLRNALANARGDPVAPPRHRSLGTAALLPAGRAALAAAPAKADAGFRVFKWKVGVEAADDERSMLDDLVAALPEGSKLRLDANGAWDRRTAEQWLAHAAERPVEYVEQPIAPDARGATDLLLGLAADYPIPVALDESIVDEGDIRRWLDLGWPGVFVIKPALIGDIQGALAHLAAARAPVVFSSALETALGAQAALRLAFAWGGEPRALGFGVWPLFTDPTFDGPATAPFIRVEDVERIDPQSLWNATS